MSVKNILLMHITLNSGHHHASIAIENALRVISPDVNILNINAFSYVNPILEQIINRTYMSVIKNRPEVWEYLYDNPKVLKSVQGLRTTIHKFNSKKLKILIDDFQTDAVVCTQAFPCGMVADYKKGIDLDLPLFAVLTDHAAHSYWIFENVDCYIVPSQMSKEQFIRNGVTESKIKILGIPIDPRFNKATNREDVCKKLGIDKNLSTVLIMGGSQGMGPVEKIVDILERLDFPVQLIVVCGMNKRLERLLCKKKKRHKKKILIFGLVENIDELMSGSDVIITKPGGVTTSEALAKNLPMIIIHPIPGQEAKNTEFLLQQGVALKADDTEDIYALVQELFLNRFKLDEMRKRIDDIKKPNSAMEIAKLVLDASG